MSSFSALNTPPTALPAVISQYLVLLDPRHGLSWASIWWEIRTPLPETTPVGDDLEVVYRAGPAVGLGQIDIGDIAVITSHFKASMAEEPLQGEGVAAVSQERNCGGVAHGVRRTPHPLQSGFLAEVTHDGPEIVLVKRFAIRGQENSVHHRAVRLGAAQRQVAPQQLLNLAAERHLSFFTALAPDFQNPLFQVEIAHLQTAQFADPQAGIEQRQDDGVIPETTGRFRFSGFKERRQLLLGEGGDDFFRRFRNFHPIERIRRQQLFRPAPVGEAFEAAEVAVQGVAGQAPVGFRPVQRVTGEALLLPQVEDEGADGVGVQIGGEVGLAFGIEEAQEVDDGRGGGLDGPGALALGGVAQLKAFQQPVDVGGGISTVS